MRGTGNILYHITLWGKKISLYIKHFYIYKTPSDALRREFEILTCEMQSGIFDGWQETKSRSGDLKILKVTDIKLEFLQVYLKEPSIKYLNCKERHPQKKHYRADYLPVAAPTTSRSLSSSLWSCFMKINLRSEEKQKFEPDRSIIQAFNLCPLFWGL